MHVPTVPEDTPTKGKDRSSILDLIIYPTLVRANCNEELTALAKALRPPLVIPENTSIAKAISHHRTGHASVSSTGFSFETRRKDSIHSSIHHTKTHHSVGKRHFGTMACEIGIGFLVGVTVALTTLKLTWKTDDPVWVDQWPLEQKKLSALKLLFKEQLEKGHIQQTSSPWNSPVFVIRKKTSGSWRLLHDLRKINEVIEEMGPLQLRLLALSMILRDWPLVIIDLKDCFFNIPLHPDDAPRFAFSIPSINRQEPLERYHWVVLPQGLKNSPTICQWLVAQALSPAQKKYPEARIIHYVDDLLIAASTQQELQKAHDCVIAEVQNAELEISTSKIQEVAPWKYLGWRISEQTIRPQKIQIKAEVNNLQDLQQLLGEIN
ncbi:hypothetical protein HGM15179_011372 [Zosterops borbonicus]|uniref:ribonuclease H n=1 Tax=Zosterops borbonicus TaxID=364589 RepID=A0A8K1GCI0_9PASS|nr:hypothetical protein HGM15179_011372 [Zosterops borbonicus]